MAAHIEEQEELENFKHFWKSIGRWIFAALVLVALAYLGWVLYSNHQVKKNQEAAAVLEQLAANPADEAGISSHLKTLQKYYPSSIAAAQGSFVVAAIAFDKTRYDEAAGHLQWVLSNQKTPLIQALAIQRLATVQLQQKKYAESLATLNTKVDPVFEPLLLETKGDVLMAQNKPKEAFAAYKQALDQLPEDAPNRELIQLKYDQLH